MKKVIRVKVEEVDSQECRYIVEFSTSNYFYNIFLRAQEVSLDQQVQKAQEEKMVNLALVSEQSPKLIFISENVFCREGTQGEKGDGGIPGYVFAIF